MLKSPGYLGLSSQSDSKHNQEIFFHLFAMRERGKIFFFTSAIYRSCLDREGGRTEEVKEEARDDFFLRHEREKERMKICRERKSASSERREGERKRERIWMGKGGLRKVPFFLSFFARKTKLYVFSLTLSVVE